MGRRMTVSVLNEYLQLAAHVVVILGLPLAILLLYREKVRERRDREYGTYNALDDKYIQFLEMCLEHPNLDVSDFPRQDQRQPTEAELRQVQILLTILVSILERAFLMYKDQSTEIKKRQYAGWVDYMKDWCSRPIFRSQWPTLGKQFDSAFLDFMNELMASTEASGAGQQDAPADARTSCG